MGSSKYMASDDGNFSDESHLLDEMIGEIRALGEKIGQPLPALTRPERIAIVALDRAITTVGQGPVIEEDVLRVASRYRRWLLAHATDTPETGE